MPKARDPNLPQHDADQGHYGAISLEMMPNGTAPMQFQFWDGVQWKLVNLQGAAGLDVSYDVANGILEIALASARVYQTMTADAYLVTTISSTFSSNSVIKKTESLTFSADAELV